MTIGMFICECDINLTRGQKVLHHSFSGELINSEYSVLKFGACLQVYGKYILTVSV